MKPFLYFRGTYIIKKTQNIFSAISQFLAILTFSTWKKMPRALRQTNENQFQIIIEYINIYKIREKFSCKWFFYVWNIRIR
jgi:hypothetical protein